MKSQVNPDEEIEVANVALQSAELKARRDAARIIKDLYEFKAFALRDEFGILRQGHGRQIERRPMTPTVADVVLNADLVKIADVLRGQVFPLLTNQPEVEAKIGLLYALSDIIGVEELRDWARLWETLRQADYRATASELLSYNWDKCYSSTPEKRRLILGLILNFVGDRRTERTVDVEHIELSSTPPPDDVIEIAAGEHKTLVGVETKT